MKYKVGQEVYWEPIAGAGQPCTVVIAKTGRLWLHLSNGQRVCRTSLVADGGDWRNWPPPGKAYLSGEERLLVIEARNAWNDLRRAFSFGKPAEGVTAERIAAAKKLLGL